MKPRPTSLSRYEAACRDGGLIKADAAAWILPIVEQGERDGLGYDAIARQIRAHGVPLTHEIKRALGMRANAKLGDAYIAALTTEGKTRIMDAAFLVIQRVMHQTNVENALEDAREFGGLLELISPADERTCAAALRLDGHVFAPDKAPELPLPDCDADYCRCLYAAVIPDN